MDEGNNARVKQLQLNITETKQGRNDWCSTESTAVHQENKVSMVGGAEESRQAANKNDMKAF